MKKDKPLTLREVARIAGTSKSTVSRVLTNHPSVSPEIRAHVESVIRKHQYRPNMFARGLTGARTGLIAVLAPWIESGFYASVIRGIDLVATRFDGHLMTTFAHSEDDYFNILTDYVHGHQVDGVIAIAPPMSIFERKVLIGNKPVVLCSSQVQDNDRGWDRCSSVTVDNGAAFKEVMEYLYRKECRNMIYVSGNNDVYDARVREETFLGYVASRPDMRGRVIRSKIYDNWGYYATLEFFEDTGGKEVPDAFVCFNDATAFGVIEALHEKMPEELARIHVTGCDDEAAAAIIGLTTLRMPMERLGKEAANCLYERISDKSEGADAHVRHRILNMELIVRDRYKTLAKYLPLNELYNIHVPHA